KGGCGALFLFAGSVGNGKAEYERTEELTEENQPFLALRQRGCLEQRRCAAVHVVCRWSRSRIRVRVQDDQRQHGTKYLRDDVEQRALAAHATGQPCAQYERRVDVRARDGTDGEDDTNQCQSDEQDVALYGHDRRGKDERADKLGNQRGDQRRAVKAELLTFYACCYGRT